MTKASYLAIIVLLVGACSPADNLPGHSVQCRCACFTCLASDTIPIGGDCTGPENPKTVSGCAAGDTNDQEACDKACKDSELTAFPFFCFPDLCFPVKTLETCNDAFLIEGENGQQGDCEGASPATLIAPSVTATRATINTSRSGGHVVMGGEGEGEGEGEGDEADFALSGSIFFDGGFCAHPPCAVAFEGFETRSPDDFFVGLTFVQDVLVRNNGEFLGEVDADGHVAIVSVGAFDVSAHLDGIFVSREGHPTQLTATLDATTRELIVGGQVAVGDDTATFSVVATFDDTAPVPVVDGFGQAECGLAHGLSASRSFDIDGDSITNFEWCETADDLSCVALGTGPEIAPTFSLGTRHIELFLTDARGRTNRALVTVDVADTLPPQVDGAMVIGSDCLWPPNHRYVVIDVARDISSVVSDTCDTNPRLIITGAESNQPDDGVGDGSTTNDVVVFEDHVCVRAERQGTEQDGRTYSVHLAGVDASGNQGDPTLEIRVGHDERPENRCTFAGEIEVADDGDPRCTVADSADGIAADGQGCKAMGSGTFGSALLALLAVRRRRR